MDNNFGWNLGGDFIAHYGTKRHSGRYPWGSGAKNGKTPIHEHGEKKHKGGSSRHDHGSSQTKLSDEAEKMYQTAAKSDRYSLHFLEMIQNVDDEMDNKTRLAEYRKYLSDPRNYHSPDANGSKAKKVVKEWEEKYGKNNGKLKIPTEPLYETKTTGGLFNKRKEAVLSEAGKKWQSEVADKTKSYYDNMDEKDLDARKKAFDKWKQASNEREESPSIEAYRKERKLYDEMGALRYVDMDKILGIGDIPDEITNIRQLYGNYKDNPQAYNLGAKTFYNEFYGFFNNKNSIKHSGLDPDNIVRILNTPI